MKGIILVIFCCSATLAMGNPTDKNQEEDTQSASKGYKLSTSLAAGNARDKSPKNQHENMATKAANLLVVSHARKLQKGPKNKQRAQNSYQEVPITMKSAGLIPLTIWNDMGQKVLDSNVLNGVDCIIATITEITDYAAVSYYLDSFYLYTDDDDSIPFNEYLEVLYRSEKILKCANEMLDVINNYKTVNTSDERDVNAADLHEIRTMKQITVLAKMIRAHMDDIIFVIMKYDQTFNKILLESYDLDSKDVRQIIKELPKTLTANKLDFLNGIIPLIKHLHKIGEHFEVVRQHLIDGKMNTGELYRAFVYDSAFDFGTVAAAFFLIRDCLLDEGAIIDSHLVVPVDEMSRWCDLISGHSSEFEKLTHAMDLLIGNDDVNLKEKRLGWRDEINRYKVVHCVFRDALTSILAHFPSPRTGTQLHDRFTEMKEEFNVANQNNRASLMTLKNYYGIDY